MCGSFWLYEVQKYCSMTAHMWDGQWVLVNGKRWAWLTPDLQAMITRNVTEAVLKQRDDIRRLNNGLEAQRKAKGLTFNYLDNKSFRDA